MDLWLMLSLTGVFSLHIKAKLLFFWKAEPSNLFSFKLKKKMIRKSVKKHWPNMNVALMQALWHWVEVIDLNCCSCSLISLLLANITDRKLCLCALNQARRTAFYSCSSGQFCSIRFIAKRGERKEVSNNVLFPSQTVKSWSNPLNGYIWKSHLRSTNIGKNNKLPSSQSPTQTLLGRSFPK